VDPRLVISKYRSVRAFNPCGGCCGAGVTDVVCVAEMMFSRWPSS
jgi:hypothetical protein